MGSELSNRNNMIIRWWRVAREERERTHSRSRKRAAVKGGKEEKKKGRDAERGSRGRGCLLAPESKYWHKGCRSGMLIDRKRIRKRVDGDRARNGPRVVTRLCNRTRPRVLNLKVEKNKKHSIAREKKRESDGWIDYHINEYGLESRNGCSCL